MKLQQFGLRFTRSLVDFAYLLISLRPQLLNSQRYYRFMKRYYQRTAPAYDLKVIAADQAYGAALGSVLDEIKDSPQRILDASTGTGYVAIELAKRFPNSQIIATDFSEEMLQQAQKRAKLENLANISFERANSASLPYPDSYFDLVTIQNAPPPFKELGRVTKEGGMILAAFSSGAYVPHYLRCRVKDYLVKLGFAEVLMQTAGDGLWFLMRKS